VALATICEHVEHGKVKAVANLQREDLSPYEVLGIQVFV
jgi:hypothetical protein